MKAKNAKSEEQSFVAHIDSIRDTIKAGLSNSKFATHESISDSERKKLMESQSRVMEELTFMIYTCWFFRMQHGLSQQQLAERTGKSRSSISKFEKGNINIDGTMILLICHALQISSEEYYKTSKKKEKEYRALTSTPKPKKNKKG